MSEEKKEEKKQDENPATDKKEEEIPVKDEKKEDSSKENKKHLEKEIEELKKKVADYQAKFEEADKKADDWKNKYFQAYADMSNTRKQVEKETSDFKKYAKQSLIEELIPALDGFDMALKNEPKDEVVKKYLQGFVMIHSKLIAVLKQQDVTIIDPKHGDEYDPDTMQAFSTVDGEEDNKVADVFTKGYKMFGHLLRPAGVIVTKKKEVEEVKAEEKPAEADQTKKD
jgi:molecular chaperone GrpE